MPFCANKNNTYAQDNILVSVCITTYNRAEGLDKVLLCITQQTHKNLQIIISDDCSPDENVKKTILRFAERDERIEYYIQDKNLRYFKNLKFVLDKSIGDFIMWCDDDDWYHPDYIKKCLTALLSDDDASCAFCYYEESDDSFSKKHNYPNQARLLERLTNKNSVMRLLAYLFSFNGYGYCNIYYGLQKKEILEWFNPENFGMALDVDVGMKLVSQGPVALVKDYLFKKNVDVPKEYLQDPLTEKFKLNYCEIAFKKILAYLTLYSKQAFNYYKVLRPYHSIIIIIFSPVWIATSMIYNVVNGTRNYNNRERKSRC